MMRYWRRNPPVHRLLAWIVGYEPPEATSSDSGNRNEDLAESPEALNNLIRDFMAAGGVVN